jgi:hypothetical protein
MDASSAAIVRFRNARNEIVGHGVLVDDDNIVTCAHVINAALGRAIRCSDSALGQVVRLEFPLLASAMAPERWARVDAWQAPGSAFEGIDVAGLTLVGEVRPSGAVPVPLGGTSPAGEVLMFGPVEGRPGGWVPGRLRPVVTQYRQQIDQEAHGAHKVQPRYSGTPIMDPTASRVLGLLVATAVGREDVDVYAIPIAGLIAAWPAVFAPLPPSPYKGLEAFTETDAPLFFGRATVAGHLAQMVDVRGLLPVVGASGVGKSSLILAGLIPLLNAQRTSWAFVVVRPRPDLSGALAAGLARAAGAPHPVPITEMEQWQARIEALGLIQAGEMVLASVGKDRLLLVIDQFEEAADGHASLLAQLVDLAETTRSRVVAVLTLREDAFGSLFVRHSKFGELLRQTAVALRGMDADDLKAAIVAPAALRNIVLHDRLVEELIRSVRGRPGALPLLEFALHRMWSTLQRGQTSLSFDAYEEIGRLDGALTEYADAVLEGLTPDERSATRQLFVTHLVSAERPDVRRVATRSEMSPTMWPIAIRLANERLLTIGRNSDGEETVEVVHEALLRAWGTLGTWLEEEEPFRKWRSHLAYAREQGAPLTGALLVASERWLADRSDLTVDERRFIEASRTRQDEEEHRYRMLFERSLARTLSVAAESAADNQLALLLAVEALERSGEPTADNLVRSCLQRIGASELEEATHETYAAESQRTRSRLALRQWINGPGATGYWSLGSEATPVIIDGRGRASVRWGPDNSTDLPVGGPVVAAACTPDTGMVCLATEAGEFSVYQVSDRAEQLWHRSLHTGVMGVAIDSTASAVAISCDDGLTRVLSTKKDGQQLAVLRSTGFVEDLDLSDGGLALALLHTGGRVLIRDLVAQGTPRTATTAPDAHGIAFTSDHEYLMVSQPTISRLPLGTTALAAQARAAAGRQLTPEERQLYLGVKGPAT